MNESDEAFVELPPTGVTSFAWSPDGLEMAFTDERGLSIYNPWEDTTTFVGDGVPPWDYDWGRGRELVFAQNGDLFVLQTGRSPFAPRPLTNTPGLFESEPDWSPSGQWVAFSAEGSGVWIVSVLDHSLHRLTEDQPDEGYEAGSWTWQPRWSPGGDYVSVLRASYAFVFASSRISRFEIDYDGPSPTWSAIADLSTSYCTPWRAACSHAWRPEHSN